VGLSIDFDGKLGRRDVEVSFEEGVLNQKLFIVLLFQLWESLSDSQIFLRNLVAFLRIFFLSILSCHFSLSISFNPIFVFLEVDIAGHLLKLLEFSLSTLIHNLLKWAGQIGDTALSQSKKIALSQVDLEIFNNLLDNLILKWVVQDVSMQNIDQKVDVFVAIQ